MPSKKDLVEYNEKYGDVSRDLLDRLYYLIDDLNEKQTHQLMEGLEYNKNMKWNKISLVFYFIPKATPRARFTRFGGHFYVSDAMNNQKLMKEFVKNKLSEFMLITTPCKFYCEAFFPTPKGMTKEEKVRAELKQIRHLSKPDWDNLGKTYSDMVQNHLILDDSLIVDAYVGKYYSIKPRVEITIEYAEDFDCNFNRKSVTKRKQYIDYYNSVKEKLEKENK